MGCVCGSYDGSAEEKVEVDGPGGVGLGGGSEGVMILLIGR